MLSLPTSLLQLGTFTGCALLFGLYLLLRLSRRPPEQGAKRERRSQLGIAIQSFGIAVAAFGRVTPTLPSLSLMSVAATTAVLLLMSGAIGLFAASSRELGRNWSLVARTRYDHELVQTGPYSRVRHPIYLGLLLFLFAFAIGLGHWVQLVIALPLFFVGTKMRTDAEEQLLEQSFGDKFRDYRNSTPAIIPKIV
jgi:protein-S-isoprenylcysteine O-methyltransferase Ste14